MPLVKSSKHPGKKQSPPSVKKPAVKSPAKAASGSSKANQKRPKSAPAYSSLKSRQMTVERMKRAIWASLLKINDAIIAAATSGNVASAKELFHLAGVYSLPNPDEENAAAATQPVAPDASAPSPEPAQVHPIDMFFKRIGIEPSCEEPVPEVA
jgi:hypothetical protein